MRKKTHSISKRYITSFDNRQNTNETINKIM